MSHRISSLQGALLAALALCLVAAAPGGRSGESKPPDFWQNLLDPGRKAFEAATERGLELIDRAKGRNLSEGLRRRLLEDALVAFMQANKASPGNADGWFRTAEVLSKLDRTKPAIAAYKRVRRADATRHAFDVAFSLGVCYSKLGAFENAVLEYDRAERALAAKQLKPYQTSGDRSIINGNAAEALMALGRLDEAIQRYQEALSLGSRNRVLIRWGLAVAYDRDEQISKAQAMAQAAIAADRNMNELKSPNVFFIPEGDIHYYFAMGYLVQGKTEEAKQQWQLFLKQLPDSQWAPRARAHLAELGVAEKRPPKPHKRLAPVPKQRTGKEETLARDRDSIRYRLQGYLYKVRRCYQRELRRDKSLTGTLKLGLTVGKNGRVLNARILRSTLGKPALHSCVLRAIREIRFSRTASGQAVKLTYPLQFKP